MIKKGLISKTKPVSLHQVGDQWFFNVLPVEYTLPDGSAGWGCWSMPIDGQPTRKKLIAAGMLARYSAADEVAILCKKADGLDEEYETHALYRASIKAQVDAAGYSSW